MATEQLIPLLCWFGGTWAVGAIVMAAWIWKAPPMPTSTIITFEELRKR